MDRYFACYAIFIVSLGVSTLCEAEKFYPVEWMLYGRVVWIRGKNGGGVQISTAERKVFLYKFPPQNRDSATPVPFAEISKVMLEDKTVGFRYLTKNSIVIKFKEASHAPEFAGILRNFVRA